MVQPLLISSTRKSSGKTIISIGLSGLANNLGYDIQTFKKGPDFIDPSWLTLASKRPCYNLDFNTMGSEEIKRMYTEKSHGMDFSLIEGTKGLFDGISTDGGDSNAELADLLKSSVLLVIDCEGITRGIAPLLEGYKSFGKKLKLNKVILNNVSTSRHESKLVSAISRYTDFRVLGVIPSIKNFIVERHLGLVPTFQHPQKKRVLSSLVSIIKNNTDYKKLLPLKSKSQKKIMKPRVTKKKNPIVVGVASDAAFGFYYPDDIEEIERHGCRVKKIDLIREARLPNIDGLFIGGGFPETQAQKLQQNNSMKKSIHNAINRGLPVYAECGGLMYLANRIKFGKSLTKMCNVFDIDIEMNEKPVGRGYTILDTDKHPWSMKNKNIHAHEFHYSSVKFNKKRYKYAYNVKRGYGINGRKDGLIYKNTIASFSHLRSTSKFNWAKYFIKFIEQNNG